MPLRSHEDIAVFYRKQPIYNPQMVKCAPNQRNHRRGDGSHSLKRGCYGDHKEVPTIVSDEKFPRSIICFDKEHSADTFHPTQKPVALIQYLICTYTNVGGGAFSTTAWAAALLPSLPSVKSETSSDLN